MAENAISTMLTGRSFQKEVLECTQPVMVEFGADWSGACHIMAPMIEELAKRFNRQIKFCKIDFDDCEPLANQYGIRELPTFLSFKNGQAIDHVVGAIPKKILAARLNALLQTQ